jgi:C-terminal processing protease CtpA/Prc
LQTQETAGEGVDFVDREYTVTFGEGRLGLMLLADKDGLIRVKELTAGGAAASSGEIRKGDIMLTVAGQSTSGTTVEEVVGLIGGAPRPLTLVFSSSVAAEQSEAEAA